MKILTVLLLISIAGLHGCGREDADSHFAISGFVDQLQELGVDGTLEMTVPNNEDIEYIANYVVSKYTSTRIISFFKCTNIESTETHFKEALKNPKMSGQARNGTIIMAATFYPPDQEAVDKIKDLFLDYNFDQQP